MKRVLSVAILLGTAACAAGRRQPADLPCAPEAAARILADGTRDIVPPAAATPLVPPARLPGSAGGTFSITLTVGADGRVIPGTVHVAGPDNAAFAARLRRWAERLRFHPAIADGCAIAREITLVVSA